MRKLLSICDELVLCVSMLAVVYIWVGVLIISISSFIKGA
jgi:hypothetical protein